MLLFPGFGLYVFAEIIAKGLGRINVPVLLIGGGLDTLFPPSSVLQQVQQWAADVRQVIVPAGHFVHLQAPDETNAAIDHFLSNGRK